MKTYILAAALALVTLTAYANNTKSQLVRVEQQSDSIKLKVDGTHCYYQQTIKVDSIPVSKIYLRALQFMASKNFQQNYGYEEEGKAIFTTTQDLNVNNVYVGDDSDVVEPYTTQFAITIDMKNGRYRYTINNVVFFLPENNGNRRETLFDIYLKATNTDSRRVAKDAKKLIVSFERYISSLTDELRESIEQKSAIHKADF
jgi:hypothetical protein